MKSEPVLRRLEPSGIAVLSASGLAASTYAFYGYAAAATGTWWGFVPLALATAFTGALSTYVLGWHACWAISHLKSGRTRMQVQPEDSLPLEPYTFDLTKKPVAPEPGPDQCPVCGAEDLPYYRDRRQTVPYGRFDAHWTCAAWLPYVEPKTKTTKFNDVIKFEIDGVMTYTLAPGPPQKGYTEIDTVQAEINRLVDTGVMGSTSARSLMLRAEVNDLIKVHGHEHRDEDVALKKTIVQAERTLWLEQRRLTEMLTIGTDSAGIAFLERLITATTERIHRMYRKLEIGKNWQAILDTPAKIGVYDEIMRPSVDEALTFLASFVKAWKMLAYNKTAGSQAYAKDFEQTFRLLRSALADKKHDPFGMSIADATAKHTAVEGLIDALYH